MKIALWVVATAVSYVAMIGVNQVLAPGILSVIVSLGAATALGTLVIRK